MASSKPGPAGQSPLQTDLPSGASEFLQSVLGAAVTLVGIAGDASTRCFYRACFADGTAVLMVQGTPLEPSSGQYSNYRVLKKIGATIPRILAQHDRLGLILFEDLGDLSLQKFAAQGGGCDQEQLRMLYLQACELIALLHRRGGAALLPEDFASRHALDAERFLFELDHFDRHFIRGLRGRTPSAVEETLLRRFYEDLAGACDGLPHVYCHRDFQSRNLMICEGRLGLIDFQDARMGPYTYDAASLLRDSSLDLAEDLVQETLDRLEEACAAPLGIGREEFRHDFDLMALQRNIKDLGTFGYMATVRRREDYLDYIPRTQASIRRTLLSHRDYHDVYGLLKRMILD